MFGRKKIDHHIHEPIFVGRMMYFPDDGLITINDGRRGAKIRTMKDLRKFITKVMLRYNLRN